MWFTKRLGYGIWTTIDGENPDSPPQVTVTGTVSSNPQLADNFGRILNDQIKDTEEMRREVPADYVNGFEYVGVAVAGTATDATSWMIIRRTWINKTVTRVQYRLNVAWDDRALGWS